MLDIGTLLPRIKASPPAPQDLLRDKLRAYRNGNFFRTLLFISATTFFLAVAAQNRNTRVLLPG